MKRLASALLIAALAVLPLHAKKKHQWTNVEKPAVAYSYKGFVKIHSVAHCDTCTRLTLDITTPAWVLPATARLVVGDKVLPVKRGTVVLTPQASEEVPEPQSHVVPLDFTHRYYGPEAPQYQEISEELASTITLDFPALPKGTTFFTFDTDAGHSQQMRATGIRLDGKTYPALLPSADEAEPFRWTASTSAEAQVARVRVNIIGENLPADLFVRPQFFPENRNHFTATSLAEPQWIPATDGSHGGTAVFRFAVPTLYIIYLANDRRTDVYAVPCVPGEEVVLTVDYNALQAGTPNYQLAYADGRPFNLTGPHGEKSTDGSKFWSELAACATNPEVAALRVAEREQAEALNDRMTQLQEVTEAEIATVALPYKSVIQTKWEEYTSLMQKLAENKGGRLCDTPNVAPAEMIKAIVAQYKGKAVYVDLWATWCGPCKQGIKAMLPHHDDFSHDDVQFVYITDESSPLDKWRAMTLDMQGDHYRLKSMSGLEPAISGIPRYLIFDREGHLSFDAAGFGPGTEQKLCDEIRKAMGE